MEEMLGSEQGDFPCTIVSWAWLGDRQGYSVRTSNRPAS